jgi:hypothetical protein
MESVKPERISVIYAAMPSVGSIWWLCIHAGETVDGRLTDLGRPIIRDAKAEVIHSLRVRGS